jgi:uncharacterized membrane-anchored protein
MPPIFPAIEASVTVFVPPVPNSMHSDVSASATAADGLLPFHADRDRLFNELHTRPFPVLEQGARVSQVALLHGGNDVAAENTGISRSCVSATPFCRLSPGSSCYYQNFGGFELRWERHTEFSTYTFIHRADGPGPFQRTALSLLPRDGWLELPGKVISGLHVDVLAMPDPAPVGDVCGIILKAIG